MEVLEQGFADGRFASTVDEDLHCAICLNVLNLPVQCQKNEHYFCTTCIKRHLRDTSECPCCKEELSVETLKKPARYFTKVLSQLRIHCDYENRGCLEVVELEVLASHVALCGFAPVRCSNEGCGQEINKQDRVSHETEVCEFRRAKCHDCAELKEGIGVLKEDMGNLKEEISDLKGGLRDKMVNLDKEIGLLKDGFKEEIGGLKDDMGELKREMGDIKIFLEEFKKQMCKMLDEGKGSICPKESSDCSARDQVEIAGDDDRQLDHRHTENLMNKMEQINVSFENQLGEVQGDVKKNTAEMKVKLTEGIGCVKDNLVEEFCNLATKMKNSVDMLSSESMEGMQDLKDSLKRKINKLKK